MDKKTITYIAGAAAAAGLASIFLKKMHDNREAEEEPPVRRGRKPGSSWERYQQRMKEERKPSETKAAPPMRPAPAPAPAKPAPPPKPPKFYCKYCGEEFRNVRAMAYDGRKCFYHPDGSYKGPHALYEGSEKPEYTCKYCGQRFRTLRLMAIDGRKCPRHPNGSYKGRHEPSL